MHPQADEAAEITASEVDSQQTNRDGVSKESQDQVDAIPQASQDASPRRRRRKSCAQKKEEEEAREPERPMTPWQQFESHVKNIGDDSNTIFSVPRNDVRFKSSNIFQKVLDEVNAKKQQQEQKRLEKLRQLELAQQQQEQQEQEQEEPESDSESEDDLSVGTPEPAVSKAVQLRAQRGWTLIKRKIHEMQMEKKNNGSMFNWKVLKATIANMSDMERSRQDLYERYLYKNDEFMGPLKFNGETNTIFGIRIGKDKLKMERNKQNRARSAKTPRTNRTGSVSSSNKSEPPKRKRQSVKR